MGVSDVVRGSFGFLLDRQHHVPAVASNINLTPSNAFQSLFHRHRDAPLPITPMSILRSMLQLDDLQALLWAWTLIGIVLLFAFWTNPDDASFRPFLTDLVFRERLRLLNHDQDAAESQLPDTDAAAGASTSETTAARKSDPNAFSSLLSTSSYSTGPFALTFGAKVALSVRTPPFHRKDLGLLSIVTISQSTPARSSAPDDQLRSPSQHATSTPRASHQSDGTVDCTSLFIGAFGKWWVLGYAIPDLPAAPPSKHPRQHKNGRPELEENITDAPEWGVLEMRSVDPDPQSRRSSIQASHISPHEGTNLALSRRSSTVEPTARIAAPTQSPSTTTVPKETISEAESQDCLSLTALVSRSQTDILDLQAQLSLVKSASARACEALEADLEEARSKKKEEEKIRSDVKSRTKALDDSKRQVESTRREAERRLKTANAARALKQASIQQRKDQVDMLHKRRAAISAKKALQTEKRQQRSAEISSLISQAKEKADRLRSEMDALRKDVQAAQDQLQLEKMFHRNAQEADHREQDRLDASPYNMWNPVMDYNNLAGNEAMYAHLASTPDPLVDSLARMEERALAAQPYMSSPFDADPTLAHNKMPNAHADAYDNLGTSVLRNAFRRANAASAVDGREMTPHGTQAIGNPSLQNASNFEAIKQAFQPSVATEEDGRRSWSAFDVWQSDLRSGSRQKMQWSSGGANASADSLPHFNASSGFLPLDRSSSAEQTGLHSFEGQEGDAEQTRNLSKVKRAFRWPFRPSQVQDELV